MTSYLIICCLSIILEIKFLTNPLPCTPFAKRGGKNCHVLSSDFFNEHPYDCDSKISF